MLVLHLETVEARHLLLVSTKHLVIFKRALARPVSSAPLLNNGPSFRSGLIKLEGRFSQQIDLTDQTSAKSEQDTELPHISRHPRYASWPTPRTSEEIRIPQTLSAPRLRKGTGSSTPKAQQRQTRTMLGKQQGQQNSQGCEKTELSSQFIYAPYSK